MFFFFKNFPIINKHEFSNLSTSSNSRLYCVLRLKWTLHNYRLHGSVWSTVLIHTSFPLTFLIFSLCLASFLFYDHFSLCSYFIIKLHLWYTYLTFNKHFLVASTWQFKSPTQLSLLELLEPWKQSSMTNKFDQLVPTVKLLQISWDCFLSTPFKENWE